jgi:O-antigen/teichoic acid export membrane protein
MLRRFLKDSAVYGVTAVVARGLSFLLIPLYTRALSPSDYGVVDMIVVFASLANLTVALEISQALARFYADSDDAMERRRYASTALWFTLGMYLLFWGVCAMAAPRLRDVLLGPGASVDTMQLGVAFAVAYGLFYLVQSQLRWQLQPLRFAMANLAMTVATLATAIVLVGWLRRGVDGVLVAQLAGQVVGIVVGGSLARTSFGLVFDRAKCRAMLRFSVPLVPASMAVFVTLYVDRFALRELRSLADVGLFAVGYRVAAISGLLMVAFQSALLPLVYAHHAEPEAPRQLARIFRLFVAGALLLCVGLSAFAPEVLRVVTTREFHAAAIVVPLLAPAILLANMYVFTPGLSIAKRTGAVAVLNVAGAVLNIVLNLLLVPHLGIVGAALATLVSAAAVFNAYMVLSQRHYPVPHDWRALLLASGMAAIVAALAFSAPVGALLLKAALVAVFAAACVGVRLIDAGEMRRYAALAWARLGRTPA